MERIQPRPLRSGGPELPSWGLSKATLWGKASWWATWPESASPICLRLLLHWTRRADSLTPCTAGRSSAINSAMIAITTSISTSVNPRDPTPAAVGRGDRGSVERDIGEPSDGTRENGLSPVAANEPPQ